MLVEHILIMIWPGVLETILTPEPSTFLEGYSSVLKFDTFGLARVEGGRLRARVEGGRLRSPFTNHLGDRSLLDLEHERSRSKSTRYRNVRAPVV